MFNSLQKFLNRSPAVDKVIGVVSEAGNPTKEVQNYQSLVQQGADLIIVQPSSAPAFLPVVKDALKQGVATVAYINPLSDASAVSVGPNVYTSSGQAFANLLKLKGGKGNFLGVHGIRVTAVDKSTWGVYNSLLAACPDVKLVGEIDGNFAPPAVRAAVLQFLATYPGPIDAVFHTAVMGPSIIGAFQQAGRTVPSVTAMAAQKGDLAYWSDNASKGYTTTGFAGGPTAITNLMTRVVLRMLAGQGPKVSDIPWPQPQITHGELQAVREAGLDGDDPGNRRAAALDALQRARDGLAVHPPRAQGEGVLGVQCRGRALGGRGHGRDHGRRVSSPDTFNAPARVRAADGRPGQGLRPDAGRTGVQLRPARGRGARDHGRERVGQEHARQDADRRPPPGSRVDRGRGPDALRHPLSAGGARARDRRGLPGGPRRPAALDPRQPLARHRPAPPGRRLERRSGVERAAETLLELTGADARPRPSGRGALAQRPAGVLYRAGAHPAAARSSSSTRRPPRSTSPRATGCSPSSGGSRRRGRARSSSPTGWTRSRRSATGSP